MLRLYDRTDSVEDKGHILESLAMSNNIDKLMEVSRTEKNTELRLKAFQSMAEHGAGGFEIVAAGISEALVATAAGLFVAIVALLFYNYLQVRVGAISATYSRSCERFVQALLFLEAASDDASSEASDGSFVPAG